MVKLSYDCCIHYNKHCHQKHQFTFARIQSSSRVSGHKGMHHIMNEETNS
jgi:hypothetical protein